MKMLCLPADGGGVIWINPDHVVTVQKTVLPGGTLEAARVWMVNACHIVPLPVAEVIRTIENGRDAD